MATAPIMHLAPVCHAITSDISAWIARSEQRRCASSTQVEPWKTAIKRVFETVDGTDYGSVDWSSIDVDEYLDRFSTLAQSRTTWKVESIATYQRRVRNALDAHRQFIETGRPPSFRRSTASPKKAAAAKPTPDESTPPRRNESPVQQLHDGTSNLELKYPLGPGRFIKMEYPQNLRKQKIDRFIKVTQTLEEQPQIPMHTGEAQAV